jgi:hypothetical protein
MTGVRFLFHSLHAFGRESRVLSSYMAFGRLSDASRGKGLGGRGPFWSTI